MKQFTEFLLSPAVRETQRARRAELELITSLAAPFLFMPVAAVSVIVFKSNYDLIDVGWLAAWFSLPLLLWLILRLTGAVRLVRDLYSLTILLFAGIGAAFSGGLQSSMLVALCILPIENMISADRRRVVLAILSVVLCLALLWGLGERKLLPPDRMTEGLHIATQPLSIIFVMFYSFLVADALIRRRTADARALAATENQYESLFEMAPIAMLEQDWSGVRGILDRLAASGVTDIKQYLPEHREVVLELAAAVKTLRVNKAALLLYRAETSEDLFEHFSPEKLTDDELRNFRQWVIAFAEGKNGGFLNETSSRRRKGGQVYIRVRSAIAPESRQNWSRVVTTIGDVTDRKRTELALRAAKEEADRANSAKSRFLASMSHELRTPLNAIIGFSEIMHKQLFGPIGQQRYMDYALDIHQSGQHLLNLINDMLDLSRIEAGRYEIHEEWIDARELFDWVLNMIEPQIIATGVEVSDDISEDIPYFFADLRAMRQIMLNLMSNALKFTPRGKTARLSARQAAGNNGIILEVADTGKGIPAKLLTKITEPFVQAGNVDTRPGTGTGLGLSITKSLVELHGGKLHLTSVEHEGTTVTIHLPVATRPGEDAHTSGDAAVNPRCH
ncbi:MAG TPA: hypothetical protein DCO82_03025 [Alphaproteobacteria bacterium]|nr:hypothetical protein [Alphaproteobacteria bacterium]